MITNGTVREELAKVGAGVGDFVCVGTFVGMDVGETDGAAVGVSVSGAQGFGSPLMGHLHHSH